MAKSTQKRADFMTPQQKSQMGNHPRTHANCKALTGVSRPGKTAQERANRKPSS
jgi:hypothetical protein